MSQHEYAGICYGWEAGNDKFSVQPASMSSGSSSVEGINFIAPVIDQWLACGLLLAFWFLLGFVVLPRRRRRNRHVDSPRLYLYGWRRK